MPALSVVEIRKRPAANSLRPGGRLRGERTKSPFEGKPMLNDEPIQSGEILV
jgi:hypothetical protein